MERALSKKQKTEHLHENDEEIRLEENSDSESPYEPVLTFVNEKPRELPVFATKRAQISDDEWTFIFKNFPDHPYEVSVAFLHNSYREIIPKENKTLWDLVYKLCFLLNAHHGDAVKVLDRFLANISGTIREVNEPCFVPNVNAIQSTTPKEVKKEKVEETTVKSVVSKFTNILSTLLGHMTLPEWLDLKEKPSPWNKKMDKNNRTHITCRLPVKPFLVVPFKIENNNFSTFTYVRYDGEKLVTAIKRQIPELSDANMFESVTLAKKQTRTFIDYFFYPFDNQFTNSRKMLMDDAIIDCSSVFVVVDNLILTRVEDSYSLKSYYDKGHYLDEKKNNNYYLYTQATEKLKAWII